jgi:UDP-2,3-diacylglucosamine pyrophosphatase LpxH
MLGTWLYDGIQATARSWNRWMAALGRRPLAAGPLLAHHAPFAREHLLRFEQEAVHLARREGVDAIAVGHIHVPACRVWTDQGRQITYLNSGDWVDSLSALEFAHGEWRIHRVEPEPLSGIDPLYDTVEVAPAG